MIGFWIRLSLTKYLLTCRVNSRYILYYKYSEPCLLLYSQTHSCIFASHKHIKPHCGIFRTPLCSSSIFRTFPYSESWHIKNSRYIENSVKAYSGIFRTLCNAHIVRTLSYSEFCDIQNFGIFRTWDIFRILLV